MAKSINRFLIEKGYKSNYEAVTILKMIELVDEWKAEEKNFNCLSQNVGGDDFKCLVHCGRCVK